MAVFISPFLDQPDEETVEAVEEGECEGWPQNRWQWSFVERGQPFLPDNLLRTLVPVQLNFVLRLKPHFYCVERLADYNYCHSWLFKVLFQQLFKTIKALKENICWGILFWSTTDHSGDEFVEEGLGLVRAVSREWFCHKNTQLL
jgi:hypothetical protein